MITFPAIIDGVRTNKDGSLKIVLETPELSPEDCTKLFSFRNMQVFAGLNEANIQPEDLDLKDFKPIEKGEKTPSQRLRAVLYLVWNQSTAGTRGDFDSFYKRAIERIIDQYKEKLN